MENDTAIGSIVLKVQEDLNRLQEKLKSKEYQENIDVGDIKELISNTQNGLHKRAEEILNHINNRVISSSNLENVNKKHKISATFSVNQDKIKRIQQSVDVQNTKGMEILPLEYSSPGENLKREMNLKSIGNPYNKMNRSVASDIYGIQLPLIYDKSTSKNQHSDSVQKGSVVKKLEKLPLETNKYFNNPKSSKLTEVDARRGLLNLIERGMIPPNAKITFDPPPINNGRAAILSASSKFRVNMPAESNDHGYDLGCYHMDDTSGLGNEQGGEKVSNSVDKMKQIPKDMNDSGMPNVLKDLIKMQNSKSIEDAEGVGSKLKKPNLSRNNKDKQSNVRAIKTIQFDTNIQEKEFTTNPNDNSEITPPPTSPASQLSKSTIDSFHKFLITDGVTRETKDDFILFKRHYCLVWGGIVTIIEELERFLKKYSIPIAFINGDRVADLSIEYELEIKPSEPELLSCIINRGDVVNLLRKPGRRFVGSNGRECAALVIQSTWRAFIARKTYLEYLRRKWAAGVIAIQWMLHNKINFVKEELRKTRLKQLNNFKRRYQSLATKWVKLNSSRRVIIHIPSIGLGEKHRSRIKNLAELQNHQMTRLCDIMDQNVDVVYVSPVAINEEISQYYSKLLALRTAVEGDKTDEKKSVASRYKIIVPEAIKLFPNHNMCLSSILKYSPKALNRIKNMIKGKTAWIVPGNIHVDDLDIADQLDVPILGTEPEVLEMYRNKSAIRRIFENSKVDIPPGECGIISLNQLHESFAQLITDNLHIKRWLFKTNLDIRSQGTAYIDINIHLSCYGWAQKEQKRYGEKWNKKWAQENAYNRILREIPDIIDNELVMVDRKFYVKKSKFWKEFFNHGGVVEAFPGSESVTNITVDLFLDPTGKATIISCGDQIHDGNPFNAWGYSMPQSSMESEVLNGICLKIAETCKKNRIQGYFSIDFVTFIEGNEENQVLWAIDIDFQYSDLISMVNLATFTTNAKFDSAEHIYSLDQTTKLKNSTSDSLNRYVCLSTRMSHSNLSMVHYSVFFQMCRAHGIGFDLKERQGTIFSLIDSFNRENISMITIGTTLEGTLESFAKNLYVLHQEISSPNMTGHGNFQDVIREIENILGLVIENSVMGESQSPKD